MSFQSKISNINKDRYTTNHLYHRIFKQSLSRFSSDIKLSQDNNDNDNNTLFQEALNVIHEPSGILSNKSIMHEMINKNVLIQPFNIQNLSVSSYDVTLGKMYYKMKTNQKTGGYCNIYDEDDIKKMWILTEAPFAKDILEYLNESITLKNVNPTDRIIWLNPHETILCHTNEAIGGRGNITTKMFARSSIGRSGIQVCACAGLGDVGFTSYWTMEVKNNNPQYRIPLIVGTRIAQIQFYRTDQLFSVKGYSSYTDKGKYQSGDDVEKSLREWDYPMMLPRLYNDPEIQTYDV